jgi:hypothetical protein
MGRRSLAILPRTGEQGGSRGADPGIRTALLTLGMMPFTFSITNGVGAGFIAYTIIAVACGGSGRGTG